MNEQRATAWHSGELVHWPETDEYDAKWLGGSVEQVETFLDGTQLVFVRLADGRATLTSVEGWRLQEWKR
jgi:hypothetical protein